MPPKVAGVRLVAENYSQYMGQLRNINNAQREAFQEGAKNVRQVAVATNEATRSVGSLAKQFLTLANITKASIIGALVLAAMKLRAFAMGAGEVAMRNETLAVSLNTVGTNAGYTAKQIAWATEVVKKQGITTQAARQSLIKLAQANIDWRQAQELARVAQDAAVIGNLNSSETFQRMIYAIQAGQTEILKTIGLNVSFQQSYKAMAAQLGIGTKELTEQQKAQARANAVLEAGAKIAGTYEGAMQTAGKQQQSMARHIEETQYNVGKLLVPFKRLSIEMQTMYWKGLQKVTTGMTVWADVINVVIAGLKDQEADVRATADAWAYMGKGAQSWARVWVEYIAVLVSATMAGLSVIRGLFMQLASSAQALAEGDFPRLIKGMGFLPQRMKEGFTTQFVDNFQKSIEGLHETIPTLYQDYDTLGKVAEESLERQASAASKAMQALADQKSALEDTLAGVRAAEGIWKQYNKSVERESTNLAKAIAENDKTLAEGRAELEADTLKDLEKLQADYAEDAAKIQRDANKDAMDRERDNYRAMEQARRRFELSQLQSLRRFRLSESRLRAEGDVIGLMRLREDYELQQQEAGENYGLSQREAQENQREEQRRTQEALDDRLRDLQESTTKQRNEILESYNKELDSLIAAHAEQGVVIQESHRERLAELTQARNDQLAELGASFRDEQKLTEDHVLQIGGILATVWGDQGAADALMKGWTERSKDAMYVATEAIMTEIEAVEQAMIDLEQGAQEIATAPPTPRPATYGLPPPSLPRPADYGMPMREGGVGVVTGPALFAVEPGVREVVAFAPAPMGGSRSILDVNVGGGIDVRGAEGASPAVIEASVQATLREIQLAAKRLKGG